MKNESDRSNRAFLVFPASFRLSLVILAHKTYV
jgi:glucose-6-phosphate-specific signal transduction histidine kinase